MKTHSGWHYFDNDNLEYVAVADGPTYQVVRKSTRLVNILDARDVLELAQRQVDGDGEVLELYTAPNDFERSVVIDSSPRWLDYLRSL